MNDSSHTREQLNEIAEAVGERNGWDFSRMQTERDRVPWEYLEIVPRYLRTTDAVLDIGTGGGEKLLTLSQYFERGIGIDPDPDMIRTARENGLSQSNVSFEEMGAEDLGFPDAALDVVLARHAPIHVPEVTRVLKPGGYFLTQQIGAHNMANIRRAFRTGSYIEYDDEYGSCIDAFTRYGCRIIATGAYDINYWVKGIASLVFWFKAIAGANEVPTDFSIDRHRQIINRIVSDYSDSRVCGPMSTEPCSSRKSPNWGEGTTGRANRTPNRVGQGEEALMDSRNVQRVLEQVSARDIEKGTIEVGGDEKTTNRQPVAHIVVGFIGSGKTTFARKLEQETGAVRFTKDEWMVRLFGNTPPQATFEEYDQRMASLATDMALKCLRAGIDVVIDEGFWVKEQREEIRERVTSVGANPILYYLNVPREVMKARTLRRTEDPPVDAFTIDEESFNYYWQFFQPPDQDEDFTLIEEVGENSSGSCALDRPE